jgi:hypothetical protein
MGLKKAVAKIVNSARSIQSGLALWAQQNLPQRCRILIEGFECMVELTSNLIFSLLIDSDN